MICFSSWFEMELSIRAKYSTFQGWERLLDQENYRRAFQHTWKNHVSHFNLRELSVSRLDFGLGKVSINLRPYAGSPVNDQLRNTSFSTIQWLFKSGIRKLSLGTGPSFNHYPRETKSRITLRPTTEPHAEGKQ